MVQVFLDSFDIIGYQPSSPLPGLRRTAKTPDLILVFFDLSLWVLDDAGDRV